MGLHFSILLQAKVIHQPPFIYVFILSIDTWNPNFSVVYNSLLPLNYVDIQINPI